VEELWAEIALGERVILMLVILSPRSPRSPRRLKSSSTRHIQYIIVPLRY